ncbi:hypothetical protein I79_025949 [Cricetulus griseus]|uniref:Uncharacterized protein n=1 Tax=Cricetulus griseus TaxID=10029 RepID=G3IPM9_CRIGR|nr:hypothetical protein I79_025949 [Cricetulus griseus]
MAILLGPKTIHSITKGSCEIASKGLAKHRMCDTLHLSVSMALGWASAHVTTSEGSTRKQYDHRTGFLCQWREEQAMWPPCWLSFCLRPSGLNSQQPQPQAPRSWNDRHETPCMVVIFLQLH